MGNTYIALASAFRLLGADFVVPPYSTKRTLNLGSKHSPEVVCLPYKLVLGNYLEAIEAGADAVLMIDSPGTCRLGQYSDMARNAIRDMGYDTKFINLDLYKGKVFELYNGFREATGNNNPVDIIRAIELVLVKIDLLDELDNVYSYYRAREQKKGSAKRIQTKALKLLDEAMTPGESRKALKKSVELFLGLAINEHKPVLNVDLTGEIYVVIDQFSNMDVENELGRLGVQVHRKINLSNWTNAFLKPVLFKLEETHGEKVKKLARDFIKRDVGGDALESIGDAVNAGNNKTDGVIHLLPFTCMPEIISQNIMHNVTKANNIPVLSLVMDEFTGKAGFVTRLEAFVDLIERRRELLLNNC